MGKRGVQKDYIVFVYRFGCRKEGTSEVMETPNVFILTATMLERVV